MSCSSPSAGARVRHGREGGQHRSCPNSYVLRALNAGQCFSPQSRCAGLLPSLPSLPKPWTEPWAKLTMELNPSSNPCSSSYKKPSTLFLGFLYTPLSFALPLCLAELLLHKPPPNLPLLKLGAPPWQCSSGSPLPLFASSCAISLCDQS